MFRNLTPVTKNILILNVVFYLASNFIQFPKLYEMFSVYYIESPYFRVWQVITHMFMHAPLQGGGGLTHILFNMITLLSFGPVLEQVLGERKYIILYFISGIGAYLLNCGWNYFEIMQGADPELIYNIPMMGASGAIFGVVAAFSTLFPDAKLFFFFIPFPIKAKYLFPGIIVISLYLGFSGSMGGIAHFAHIGGAIVGFILARAWKNDLYRYH
ncbi:rhomboid family intramembrane serine protease [Chryseobacterium salipaludis]|uniref:rhomboid family intramembrane serine protease n=1 Tax=Chryseobacterium TaxID=59732 RepID=UPI000E7EECD4|nr:MULTISPECIES: rhomboid family intramembrane serine protease [Chryseobacterium]MCJ8497354.1 rhomboid family intramembrane serine protease [Chryseobacterium salipaludis]MCX3295761.1 rhomboid family intramembrane serine protease [Planobacterium sp. JC490]HAV01651.1 rhomboid family intramembrane serine protease [Chryseobacterium sp.]